MKFAIIVASIIVCLFVTIPSIAQQGHWVRANRDSMEIEGFVSSPDGSIYRLAWGALHNYPQDFQWQRSDNDARTWVPISSKGDGWQKIISDSSGILFTNHEGFSRSTDKGDTWIAIDSVGLVQTMLTLPDGDIFAATKEQAFLSDDHGVTWRRTAKTIPGTIIDLSREVWYTLSTFPDSAIYRSTNRGETWTSIFCPSLFSPQEFSFSYSTLTAVTPAILLLSMPTTGVYRSTDSGNTWTRVFFDRWNTDWAPDHDLITGVMMDRDVPTLVGDSGCYVSPDSGLTWRLVNSEATFRQIVYSKQGTRFAFGDDMLYRFIPASSVVFSHLQVNELPSAYPNPCVDHVRIELPQESYDKYIIQDILGRVVAGKTLSSDNRSVDIDVSTLSCGSYHCLLLSNSGTARCEFTVAR
jgi:hypothetical protein